MSTTINNTQNTSGMRTTTNYEEASTITLSAPEGETGCSPKINFYPSANTGGTTSIIHKRGGVGQSMPVGNNGQRRR